MLNSRRFYISNCCELKQLSMFGGPDHHWQYSWRVAWTSSRMYAGKRRTLRATIVTIFSFMTSAISVFVKCDTIFRGFWKLPQFHTSNFRKVVRQRTEGMVGSIIWFCCKFTWLSAVKEFWKSVKNWQTYRHAFGVLLFGHFKFLLKPKF